MINFAFANIGFIDADSYKDMPRNLFGMFWYPRFNNFDVCTIESYAVGRWMTQPWVLSRRMGGFMNCHCCKRLWQRHIVKSVIRAWFLTNWNFELPVHRNEQRWGSWVCRFTHISEMQMCMIICIRRGVSVAGPQLVERATIGFTLLFRSSPGLQFQSFNSRKGAIGMVR